MCVAGLLGFCLLTLGACKHGDATFRPAASPDGTIAQLLANCTAPSCALAAWAACWAGCRPKPRSASAPNWMHSCRHHPPAHGPAASGLPQLQLRALGAAAALEGHGAAAAPSASRTTMGRPAAAAAVGRSRCGGRGGGALPICSRLPTLRCRSRWAWQFGTCGRF